MVKNIFKLIFILIIFSVISISKANDSLWVKSINSINSINSIIPIGIENVKIQQLDENIVIDAIANKYYLITVLSNNIEKDNLGIPNVKFINVIKNNEFFIFKMEIKKITN